MFAEHVLDSGQVHAANTGATTLWEYWSDCEYQRSLNHPMFGAASKQLFYDALGMRQVEGSAGWKKVHIEPKFTDFLPEAAGHIDTPLGRLAVAYRRTLSGMKITVDVLDGMQAELAIKGKTVPLAAGRYEGEWKA